MSRKRNRAPRRRGRVGGRLDLRPTRGEAVLVRRPHCDRDAGRGRRADAARNAARRVGTDPSGDPARPAALGTAVPGALRLAAGVLGLRVALARRAARAGGDLRVREPSRGDRARDPALRRVARPLDRRRQRHHPGLGRAGSGRAPETALPRPPASHASAGTRAAGGGSACGPPAPRTRSAAERRQSLQRPRGSSRPRPLPLLQSPTAASCTSPGTSTACPSRYSWQLW